MQNPAVTATGRRDQLNLANRSLKVSTNNKSAFDVYADLAQVESLPSPDSPRRALEDQRIARLYHHYINDLSKWYDLSDSGSTFSDLVPRIALEESLLFCAVIALSAMHLCKTTTRSIRPTAEFYHQRCVRLLIALVEHDELISKGIALAATCLLRSYEILDGEYAAILFA